MKAVMLGYWVIFLGVVLQVFALLWDVVDDLAGEEALGGLLTPERLGRHSVREVAVYGASTASGARIIQWPYTGANNQLFRLDPVGGGYYRIVARHSGKALDVYNASTANGVRIIQWNYTGANNQKFSAFAESPPRLK